ncbi:MAG: hypothetical protein AB7E47_02235 [Desulfovibrionaceae bacterium]
MRYALVLLILLGACPAWAGAHEAVFANAWCTAHVGLREYVLPDGTRCDCLTATHAVEVEFAGFKLYEAVGQALHYAGVTGKRAGIVLVLRTPRDIRYVDRLRRTIKDHGLDIDVWTVGPETP